MSDIWLPLILATFAAYRLTRMVTTDLITEPLRRRVWARWPDEDTLYPDDGTVSQDTDDPGLGTTARGVRVFYDGEGDWPGWRPVSPTLVGYLVGCDDCCSVWTSALVSAPVGLALGLGWWTVLLWLGVAGLVAALVRYA